MKSFATRRRVSFFLLLSLQDSSISRIFLVEISKIHQRCSRNETVSCGEFFGFGSIPRTTISVACKLISRRATGRKLAPAYYAAGFINTIWRDARKTPIIGSLESSRAVQAGYDALHRKIASCVPHVCRPCRRATKTRVVESLSRAKRYFYRRVNGQSMTGEINRSLGERTCMYSMTNMRVQCRKRQILFRVFYSY